MEPDRKGLSEGNQKLLWCPFAKIYHSQMKTRGTYKKGYPIGAIVHFTAGRDGTGTIDYGITQGHCYNLLTKDGTLYQTHPLNKWGYHAGASTYPGLGSGVSQYLVGIEISCVGALKVKAGTLAQAGNDGKTQLIQAESWFDSQPQPYTARYSPGKENQHRGWYEAYTAQQEKTLVDFLLWLKHNNPNVFQFKYVLGHDEVAPTRKNDPGASLSITMPNFRAYLESEYAKRYQSKPEAGDHSA